MGNTNIPLDESTRDRLRVFKSKEGETYDEAINRLLDEVEE